MSGPSGGRVSGGGTALLSPPEDFYYSDERARAEHLLNLPAVTFYARWHFRDVVRARWARIPVYCNADGNVGAALGIYKGPGLAKIVGGSAQVAALNGEVKLLEFDFGAEHLLHGECLLAWRALNTNTWLQYFGLFKANFASIAKSSHGIGYINNGYGLTLPDPAPTWATMLSPGSGFIPFFALTRRASAQD